MEEMTIQQIFPSANPVLYSQVLNLRNELLRKPIGLDLFQEDLSQEENHIIFAAILKSSNSTNNPRETEAKVEPEGKVVGCLILASLEGDAKTFKFRQMAVSPNFQGHGIGRKLVKIAEEFAKNQGKTRIYLHGRKHAVGFYLKLGYHQINEQEFLELGIPHNALQKFL